MIYVTYKRFVMWVSTHGAETACTLADNNHVPGAVVARWLARLAPTGRA